MKFLRQSLWISIKLVLVFALLAVLAGSVFSQSTGGRSRLLSNAKNLGPEDPSKAITVNVWLKQRNQAAFDSLVKGMYRKGSPNYHKFLTMAQYKARFAPTDQQAAVVREFLTTHNLTVSSTDKNNHYVAAGGSVAA